MRAAAILLSLGVASGAGCDNNRYELSKDATGNTVRLDKRTGEVAIIKGDHIQSLKDVAALQAEQKQRTAKLEEQKTWDDTDIANIGVHATLQTLWRDGKIFYQFRIFDLNATRQMDAWAKQPSDKRGDFPKIDAKKRDEALRRAGSHLPFTLKFSDRTGFDIASLSVLALTRVVDDDGLAMSLVHNSSVPMTDAEYERLAAWNVGWNR